MDGDRRVVREGDEVQRALTSGIIASPRAWTAYEDPRSLTASVADRYTFAPNGRYASAAAAMTTTRISPTELLQTTNAYFGDGAYAISGNTITLTADNDRGNPKHGHFRVEQDSKDGGATWTDRLCLLLEGITGEVCYTRDQAP